MKFWVGLAIGLAVGAAAMYLGLRPPWRTQAAPADAPVAEAAPADAGVAAPTKKKRGKRTGRTSSAAGAVEREVDDDVTLTAADKKVEWRGDAVAVPSRTIDMTGGGDDGRPLDDDEIAAGVTSGSGAVAECIKDAAGAAPLDGEVTLQVLVGGDGRVTKARVRAAVYLHEHGLTACARRAARDMRFAATGAPTVVTAPFYLN